jgi:hypothetical protein
VRDLVGGEGDLGVLEEALREEIGERVVFFVEGEGGGVGNACDAAPLAYRAEWVSEEGRETYASRLSARLSAGRRRGGRARI